MQKLHELIDIVDELLGEGYILGEGHLSNIYDECIGIGDPTFDETYKVLIDKIIHSGIHSNFATLDKEEEVTENGVTTLSVVEIEILSIYDQEQLDVFTSGDYSEERFPLKKLSFESKHWFILSAIEDWR